MSSEAPDGSKETQDGAAESGADAALDERLLGEEADEKQWRDELDQRRAELGDTEEACLFLLDDLLMAIFQEMQVRAQNASLFALATRQACVQAFESVEMGAFQPADSLDHVVGATQDEPSSRQQVLMARNQATQKCSQRLEMPRSTLPMTPPPLVYLRRLLNFLEKRPGRAELELQRFPSSEAVVSLSGRRKLLVVPGANGHNRGEWCILMEHTPVFLQELTCRGLVSALPSATEYVLAANQELLDKKHHNMHVALPQLQHFVERAVLAAEEHEEEERSRWSQAQPSSDSNSTAGTESTPRSCIFQTEVPLRAIAGSSGDVDPSEELKGPQQELLSSYLAESPPRAIEMDRRAPGQVSKKVALSAANPSRRALSRKVIMLMAPPPRQSSKWTNVRNKIIIPTPDGATLDGVTVITAEADMELNVAQAGLSTISERKATVAGANAMEVEDTPDAAALSNIFSLGTPRQLSAQELARRNDLLAQLEREAIRAERRATATVMASMSLGGPPQDESVRPSQAEQQRFHAYVAANSIVTTGFEYETRPAALSPTRPERSDQAPAPRRRERGGSVARSKVEVERDSLSYQVSDGNAHAREEQERLSAAVCSPIKRPRASVVLPSPPVTPGRPIQTASTLAHLPQLDSSRLAVGVSAVVRGIEKRGPRRNPSRKSRLQLHNYSKPFDDDAADANGSTSVPFSPVRTSDSPAAKDDSSGYRLPLIPVMSPIKASPHRKHVAFKFTDDTAKDRPSRAKMEKPQQSPPKAKQQVWDHKTISPPRSRNRHFASGRHFRKVRRYIEDDDSEESASARRQKQEEHDLNIFRQPMAAPRRAVLPAHSELDDI